MNIRLCEMTKDLCRAYFQDFSFDPDLFMDPDTMKPYIYQPEKCDAIVDRYEQLGRIYMAVMLDDEPIGEVILKKIDHQKQCCTLGIHMKNDRFKNKGYGTQAEIMILKHAFEQCNMNVVKTAGIRQQHSKSCKPFHINYYSTNPSRTQQNFYFVAFVFKMSYFKGTSPITTFSRSNRKSIP